uniref:Photosystem I reaction center subunit V, chloroplastic n=1 Tax=Syntrichia ruralis TaxID=38588 RepID=PSAG_SYNRU|nr:RecName: Full=Photosystem I reaction center subunit V, chloroplastic; AltName: Full=PSI-G; Flags: Precursor [Syntrichia ruralis]AAD46189.1 photosystem I reaction center subunit V precursor [Syntrichia ruralis]
MTAIAKSAAKVTCDGANTSFIISASTAALLALGRFVFLPFQRSMVSRHGLPEQNGVPTTRRVTAVRRRWWSMLKTNDPAGFTLVDVLAWGALGHAVGFFILATATNGYNGFQ